MNVLKRLGYRFLPMPLSTGGATESKALRIGYAAAASRAGASTAADQAKKLKWYFAHASVGSNMVDGLTDLREKDPAQYPLRTIFSEAKPPATTEPGIIYEHNRGNPGWRSKFDRFQDCVSDGWHYPRVDLVMNKLCYIDQSVSFRYYIHSMSDLEVAFPQTKVVYMTMPLTTATDGDAFKRNIFNDQVREWTSRNGRILFDIADIEAHDPNGRPCTFQYQKQTCQRLFEGYTNDGGHLIGEGRQLAARGFYALASALAEKTGSAPQANVQK
jgi:hypothetical protein